MSDEILIVIHDAADTLIATEIARQLLPHTVVLMNLGELAPRPTKVGPGAICALVWTEASTVVGVMDRVQDLFNGAANGLICCVNGAAPPDELAAGTFDIVPVQAGAVPAEAMLKGVASVQARRARARARAAPRTSRFAPTAGPTPIQDGRRRITIQGATGFAATLAVVGVAAPMVIHSPARVEAHDGARLIAAGAQSSGRQLLSAAASVRENTVSQSAVGPAAVTSHSNVNHAPSLAAITPSRASTVPASSRNDAYAEITEYGAVQERSASTLLLTRSLVATDAPTADAAGLMILALTPDTIVASVTDPVEFSLAAAANLVTFTTVPAPISRNETHAENATMQERSASGLLLTRNFVAIDAPAGDAAGLITLALTPGPVAAPVTYPVGTLGAIAAAAADVGENSVPNAMNMRVAWGPPE